MKTCLIPLLLSVLLLGAFGNTRISAQDGKPPTDRKPTKEKGEWKGGGERGEADISEEDRERLHRLLRQVWDDPAVVQSRDEVKVASENLRRVLSQKMRQLDPEAAELMAKMRSLSRLPGVSDGRGGGSGGRRPYHPDSGKAGLDYMARPPFYASFSKEQREIYDAAYQKALKSEALEGVVGKLEELRKEDDAVRNMRIQQLRRAREVMFTAMKNADPRVGDLLRKRDESGAGEHRGDGPRPPKKNLKDGDGRGTPGIPDAEASEDDAK